MSCPKCGNTIGFAFGRCVECGWNHLSNQWEVIKVRVDYLPDEIKYYLINEHARKYENNKK